VSKRVVYFFSAFCIISIILAGCQIFSSGTDHQSTETTKTATTISTDTSQMTSILESTTEAPPLPSSSATESSRPSTITSTATKATTVPTTKTTTHATTTPTSATTTTKGTTAAPTTSSDILAGEFVAINVYLGSSIAYHRAVMVSGGDLYLLSCSETPYKISFDPNTGLKSIIIFCVKDETFSLTLDNHEYAWKTALEEKYLTTASRTVYIGRTGINISVSGNRTKVVTPTLQGIVVFNVATCDIIS
jgi:cytoskeletal protein RodZ